MARVTLIGNDAKLSLATLGAEETGTTDPVGAVTTIAGYYLVTSVSNTTSALAPGILENQLLYASTVGAISLTGGSTDADEIDAVKPITFTEKADIDSWNLELTRPEVDVTVLVDPTLKYEYDKTDASGSMSGVMKLGITDTEDGIINGFVPIINIIGSTEITQYAQNLDNLYMAGYIQKSTESGETEAFYFGEIGLGSFTAGGAVGSKQAFTSSFRPKGDVNLALYKRAIA